MTISQQITPEEEASLLARSLPPSDFDSLRAVKAMASLISSYRAAIAETAASRKHGWRCFHCGEHFLDEAAARDHFGFEQSQDPACRIKLGAERSLLHSLREAERSAAEAWSLLHDESAEGMKAYRAAQGRHGQQVAAAEELGYERGLRDARREYAGLMIHVHALLDALDADCFWRPHHPGLPQKDTAAAYEADRGQHSMTYGHIRAVAAALANAQAAIGKPSPQPSGSNKNA